MARHTATQEQPSVILTSLGGAAGTLLLSALLFLAPVFGFPFLDFPRLLGGLFTPDPDAAFWLGFGLFFVTGWLIFAPLLSVVWKLLPGGSTGLSSALLKGTVWGLVLWVLSGVLLPALGALNQVEAVANPGFFGLEAGLLVPLALLLGHLLYGLAVALVGDMGRGISPQGTLGWGGRAAGREA